MCLVDLGAAIPTLAPNVQREGVHLDRSSASVQAILPVPHEHSANCLQKLNVP